MGHFSLNVDPDSIEAAGAGLSELGNHLTSRSTEIKSTGGEIPESDWKGAARTSIMKEVEALGSEAAKFGPMRASFRFFAMKSLTERKVSPRAMPLAVASCLL